MSKVIAKEIDEEEERKNLSGMTEKELVAKAKKDYKIDAELLKKLDRDGLVNKILDAMAYKWKDPSGHIHRITNRGFLFKDTNGGYFMSIELYELYLYRGSTV